MRIKFDHPAVVTGTWENGHVRKALKTREDMADVTITPKPWSAPAL